VRKSLSPPSGKLKKKKKKNQENQAKPSGKTWAKNDNIRSNMFCFRSD